MVQLTATADSGYTFTGWTGDLSGTEDPTTITLDGDKTISATFTQDEYTLDITINGMGSVTKNPTQDTYHYGDVVTLTATAGDSYTFTGWSGALTGIENPASITIDGDMTIAATFSQGPYSLTVTTVGSGSVSFDDPGPYYFGDVVQLTASADPGWTFDGWSGDLVSTDNPASITINGNMIVTATFTQNEYTLTTDIMGQGTVDRTSVGPYHYGDEVTLTAIPQIGWNFSGWGGDASGTTSPVTITMDGDKTVTATFTQIEYTLDITAVTGGSVAKDPDQATYHYGDEVLLTAVAQTGYTFDGWGGDLSGSANPTSITINGDMTITATFTYHYTLREPFDSISGWNIKGSPKGYSATVDSLNYKEGSGSIKLTYPNNGYVQITDAVNWMLTASEQGHFQFWVYMYGETLPTSGSIILTNDKPYKNYYIANYGSDFTLTQGWNLITLDPTDWAIGAGSPDWNNPILGIRITLNGRVSNSYSFDEFVSGAGLVP